MNQSFQLAAGQTLQPRNLPFWAQSVQVDNPGGQWVIVPQANLTVPPFTVGAVGLLDAASTSVYANTVPPSGQANTAVGSPATLTFTDEALAPSAGSPTGQNLAQAAPIPQFIDAQVPAGLAATFGAFQAFGAAGVVYRLAVLSVHLWTTSAAGNLGISWQAGYGASAGVGQQLWQGLQHTGVDGATVGAVGRQFDLAFPADTRPPFTGVAGSGLWVSGGTLSGGNLGASALRVRASFQMVIATL